MLKTFARLSALLAATALSTSVLAQGAVKQVGPVTPGHAAVWNANGQLVDSATAGVSTANTWYQLQAFQGGFSLPGLSTHGVVLGEGASGVNATSALASGQLLVGQGSGLDPLAVGMSGDASISASGVLSLSNANSTPGACGSATSFAVPTLDAKGRTTSCTPYTLGTFAFQNYASPPVIGATTPNTVNATSFIGAPDATLAEQFNLTGRQGVGIPVAYMTPVSGVTNTDMAFDLFPSSGTPTDHGSRMSVAWEDICSQYLSGVSPPYECLTLGRGAPGENSYIGTSFTGTGMTYHGLILQPWGGNVEIGPAPDAVTNPPWFLTLNKAAPNSLNGNVLGFQFSGVDQGWLGAAGVANYFFYGSQQGDFVMDGVANRVLLGAGNNGTAPNQLPPEIILTAGTTSGGYGTTTIQGAATVTGGILIMNGGGSINGAAGTSRVINYQTSGSERWNTTASSEAEGGSNSGSNYWISRFDDTGAKIDTPLTINRASGLVTILDGLTVSGGSTSLGTTSASSLTVSGSSGLGTTTASSLTTNSGGVQALGITGVGQLSAVAGSGSSWYGEGLYVNSTTGALFLVSSAAQTTQAAAETAAYSSFRPLTYHPDTGQVAIDGTGAGTTIGASGGTLTINSNVVLGGTTQLKGYTVAALPTCNASGQQGEKAFVTDASGTPAWHGALAGGGSGVYEVFCTGTGGWVYQ